MPKTPLTIEDIRIRSIFGKDLQVPSERTIRLLLGNLLSYQEKRTDAPASAAKHLATALVGLLSLSGLDTEDFETEQRQILEEAIAIIGPFLVLDE